MRPYWIGVCVLLAGQGEARAEAEHYENVRVDAGLTGARASVSGRKGSGFAIEIKGMAHDNIAIGGRVELAVMFGGEVGMEDVPLETSMTSSGILKGEYLVGTGILRPFVGFGVGGYTTSSQSIQSGPNQTGITSRTGRHFGVAPQIGIDIGPVRLAATYNAIFGAYLEVNQTIGTVEQTERLSQNYLSLEVSYQFAGGRKPPPPSAATPAPAPTPTPAPAPAQFRF